MRKNSWGIGALILVGCSAGGDPGSDPGFQPSTGPSLGGPVGGKSGVDFVGEGGLGVELSQPPLGLPVKTAGQRPPPVSGGTLLVMRDEQTAIVADPDRDQVVIVNLEDLAVSRTVLLEPRSEPGRAVDDADGHVHLVLRGSGKLLTFDPATGEVLGTRSVCAYPRGVAISDAERLVHVACAEGKLVTLSTDAANETPIRTLTLDRDLRDVVVTSDGLWLSRFRSAEILRIDAAGNLQQRISLPASTGKGGDSVAGVAWRMVADANGGVIVVHQRAFTGEVVPRPGGYGSDGEQSGIVESAISTVSDTGATRGTSVALAAPLPVDIAQSPVSGRLLVASATIAVASRPARSLLLRPSDLGFSEQPFQNAGPTGLDLGNPTDEGQLVAVAFVGDTPLMQFREPGRLVFGANSLSLPGHEVDDTGNLLFHLQTGSGLACASCHPEGQEDGHVWNFSGFGPRRTQSLRGGLLGTEPFHWDGAEADFTALTQDVMLGRMSGPPLTPEETAALASYIDQFPAMPAPADASTPNVERGRALFNDTNVGCATCHSGSRFTNNQTTFVGNNGGNLQVPGLVGLWARAPYLHDGCAKTLEDRFTVCDTGRHGNLQGLLPEDLSALTAYLETL